MLTRETMRGLYALPPTPFDERGDFWESAYAENLRKLVELGVDGIVSPGSNGEWWTLRPQERCRQMEVLCEECAGKAKRWIPWQLGALAGFAALATGSIVAGEGLAAMVFFPAASMIVMTLGAVHLMKLANRSAQRQIASGEFPDFEALGPGTSTDATAALTEGPAV